MVLVLSVFCSGNVFTKEVKAADKQVASIKIVSNPKLTYYEYLDAKPDFSGMKIEITYSDQSKEELTYGETSSLGTTMSVRDDKAFDTTGIYTYTVDFGGKTTMFNVRYLSFEDVSKTALNFGSNNALSGTGNKVYMFSTGESGQLLLKTTKKAVYTFYRVSDMYKFPSVSVTKENAVTKLNIDLNTDYYLIVTPSADNTESAFTLYDYGVADSVSIAEPPTKTSYFGDVTNSDITLSGLKLKIHYSNGYEETVDYNGTTLWYDAIMPYYDFAYEETDTDLIKSGNYTIKVYVGNMSKNIFVSIPVSIARNNINNIEEATVTYIANQVYTGSPLHTTFSVNYKGTTLTEGTDYTVEYSGNTNVGTGNITIKGIGEYGGTKTASFQITPKSVSSVEAKGITDKAYTGSPITQSMTVTDGNKTLKENEDYTVSYNNNINVGTASVVVTGKGNYQGTKTFNFKIASKNISGVSISGVSTRTYTGKSIVPKITVKSGATLLRNGTDYTVSCWNNKNPGNASLRITGKGNYTGTKTITFKIVPGKVSTPKLKGKSKSLSISWKRRKEATGYEVYVSTKKSSGYKKVKTITKNSTVKYTKKKLKRKKKYYVKVRAYKKVGSKKYYGTFSSVKSAKTK